MFVFISIECDGNFRGGGDDDSGSGGGGGGAVQDCMITLLFVITYRKFHCVQYADSFGCFAKMMECVKTMAGLFLCSCCQERGKKNFNPNYAMLEFVL